MHVWKRTQGYLNVDLSGRNDIFPKLTRVALKILRAMKKGHLTECMAILISHVTYHL